MLPFQIMESSAKNSDNGSECVVQETLPSARSNIFSFLDGSFITEKIVSMGLMEVWIWY